ncbi:MAG: CarD family transcriptional regulator [Thermoleophilia bacterium]|jgi:CarD family transcriptional regulator
MMFDIGDIVVYPHHGAGSIADIVERERDEGVCSYYVIRMLHTDMTVMVPVGGSDRAGLRAVSSEETMEQALNVLREDATAMPANWNHRIRHNRDKIGSGDVLEIAGVLRNLAVRDHDKGLSTGEKQMYEKVRRILASEVMCAKGMQEDDALGLLDGVLAEVCTNFDRRGAE